MKFETIDFAKGKKTVSGLIILLLPTIVYITGWDLDQNTLLETVNAVFTLFGSALTVYGFFMKIIRKIKK